MPRRPGSYKDIVIGVLAICCVLLLYGRSQDRPVSPEVNVKGEIELANFRLKSLNSKGQDLKRSIADIRAAIAENPIDTTRKHGNDAPDVKSMPLQNDLADGDARPRHQAVREPEDGAGLQVLQPQQHSDGNADVVDGNLVANSNLFSPPSSRKVFDSVVGLDHVKSMAELNPVRKQSKDRSGVPLVVGVPTVYRSKKSYLVATLQSLVTNLGVYENSDILFVVMVADTDATRVQSVFQLVMSEFASEVASGMIDIIAPPGTLYPNYAAIPPSFGDPKDRFMWRTKQVFDFAYLMMYTRSRGLYYLQVEDDIQAMPNYASHILERAKKDSTWDVLEFSSLGFIGKLFRASDLTGFVHFFLANAFFKPVDWLLDDWFYVRYCTPEKDNKDCRQRKAKHRILFKPSLFQHIGHFSSLEGKIQKLTDRSFKRQNLPSLHTNPAAVISSSVKHFQQNSIEAAYLQTGTFWGMGRSAGDRITFTFESPVRLKRVVISSGSPDHPGDVFASSVKLQYLTQEDNNKKPTEPNWRELCVPDVRGTFDCSFPAEVKDVRALSIFFLADSKQWILVPAVYLHT